MSNTENKMDLSKLPENAKKELYDFYLFLLTKYSEKKENNKTNEDDDTFINGLIPRKIKNIKPIDRESNYAR